MYLFISKEFGHLKLDFQFELTYMRGFGVDRHPEVAWILQWQDIQRFGRCILGP